MVVRHDIIESLRLLPHAQEVQDYLIDLTAAITGKKKPSADFGSGLHRKSATFVNEDDIDGVVEQIQNIFHEKGYRTPWDLENDLIRHYHPDISESAIERADHYAAAERDPDHLTHYYQKTQVPLVMGSAALYGKVTGRPVSVLEIDYSNMRGTNDHNVKILTAAEPLADPRLIRFDAMNMTDQSALIVATAIQTTLRRELSEFPDLQVIPMRTGGDEVRLVIIDVPQDMVEKALPAIHEAIDIVTAKMDLHDHTHHKDPLDPVRNGFGGAGTVFTLKADGNYEATILRADQEIKIAKEMRGRHRLNNPDYAALKPPPYVVDLHDNPKAVVLRLESIMTAVAELRVDLDIAETGRPNTPSLEELATSLQLDHFLTTGIIRDKFHDHLKQDLKDRNIHLIAAQERILQIKVAKFPANDYSSGTLSSRDLPAMAGAALRTVRDINVRTNENADLIMFGASFHNFAGLNEALGHENANLVLQEMASNVLGQTFARHGIAKENVVLSHMGGGEFRAVIQPVMIDPNGTTRQITPDVMADVIAMMREKMAALNDSHIGNFITFRGGKVPSGLPEKFSDIINPRAELRPAENGIIATIVAAPYKTNPGLVTRENRLGGAIVTAIGALLEETITKRRGLTKESEPRTDGTGTFRALKVDPT